MFDNTCLRVYYQLILYKDIWPDLFIVDAGIMCRISMVNIMLDPCLKKNNQKTEVALANSEDPDKHHL